LFGHDLFRKPGSTFRDHALGYARTREAGPGSARTNVTFDIDFIKRERKTIMTIKVGDRLPEAKFRVMTGEGPGWKTTDDVFKGKKVALFAVPGAFTGTCHKMHLPSIVQSADGLKGKGIDTIAVTAVNDVFVMDAWKKASAADKVDFLADGNGEFAKALDITFDGSGNGLGVRSRRYSMLVEDGVVKKLNIEEAPGKVEVSGGDTLLKQL
jgi:peroxiredoxin